MQNVTPALTGKKRDDDEGSFRSFTGGAIGFASYWCAMAIPFILYGSSVLIFFLYTWLFFLALLPVSVLIGIVASYFLHGKMIWTALITLPAVIFLFWSIFTLLNGW